MTSLEREKLVELRIQAKLGHRLTREEQKFVEKMFNDYPDEYPSDIEIFRITEKFVNPLANKE